MAACELQEEVLVQLLPSGPLPRRQENVAPYVLVHNAAAGRHAAEGHVDVFIKLDGHLQGGQSEGLAGGIGSTPALPRWVWPTPPRPPSRGPTCRMSQLTFHWRMLLKRQVLTTSPTARSMRISRLLAMPRISSFLLPLNLVPRRTDVSKGPSPRPGACPDSLVQCSGVGCARKSFRFSGPQVPHLESGS